MRGSDGGVSGRETTRGEHRVGGVPVVGRRTVISSNTPAPRRNDCLTRWKRTGCYGKRDVNRLRARVRGWRTVRTMNIGAGPGR